MLDTNDVDTLEQENQNTETELEVSESEVSNQESGSSDLSPERIASMSEEEFMEFMGTNAIAKYSKQGESVSKDTSKEDNISETPSKEEKVDSVPTEEINYENVYKELFKPFKANGKEITPRNIDDIKQLMQMGANYTKKLQQMAPLRKAAETIRNADISDEDLNFLIDLHKGDKEAIKKLLDKNKIDPLDIDLSENKYVPKNHIVSDADVEYSNVLDEIQDSLPQIQDIIKNTWDTQSKEAIVTNPKLLYALHEEIQSGRFKVAQAQLEMERVFGRYKGVSDLDAYISIVSKPSQGVSNPTSTQEKVIKNPSPTKPIPDKTRAAPTSSKATVKGKSLTAKDLFSMSEEEFKKLNIYDLV